jgi:hypothetical protein
MTSALTQLRLHARDLADRCEIDEDPEGLGGEWCHFCQRQTPGHEKWCDWIALRAALAAAKEASDGS